PHRGARPDGRGDPPRASPANGQRSIRRAGDGRGGAAGDHADPPDRDARRMSISTHVLDTMRGTPAAGLAVVLHRREPDGDWKQVAQSVTDSDGRVRDLTEEELEPGEYRLEFDTRPYFERSGLNAFYPAISVVFNFEEGSLHVPLLLSPFGYTTY